MTRLFHVLQIKYGRGVRSWGAPCNHNHYLLKWYGKTVWPPCILYMCQLYPWILQGYLYPRTTKLYGGILVSLVLSVCLSVCASVHPSHIPCSLCSTYSSSWIHFLYIHLIEQLQKVCHVWCFLQNFKTWIFGIFFKFVTLTLLCFDLGSDVNHWCG